MMASCLLHPEEIIAVAERLSEEVSRLEFSPPVTHVYNPLEYAWEPHRLYLERYSGAAELEVILLGMNPGPFGMAQTGVPFGEVGLVRDWLEIEGEVGRPMLEHPRRPVQGFACHRSEVSGRRLWGWAKERFVTPPAFFRRFFVANYCPLMFMEASGRNRTPDKLPATERAPLLAVCDAALAALVELLQPRYVVGIGVFAEQRARRALQGLDVRVERILHPSPASPAANRDWQGQATAQLAAMGIDL
jgi:single-strand selective monofunctional uracil DNA glycosylase